MRTSEQVDKIAKAFRIAQQELEPVKKTATNPYFNSSYAPLDECYAAAVKSLHTHDISVIQTPSMIGETFVLTTRLQHDSGQFYEGDYLLNPTKPDPQGYGSATTYARRYSLCSMVGLCPEDDDDGNAASKKQPNENARPQRATPQRNNGGVPTLRERGIEAVRQWSGVQPEDVKDAVKAIAQEMGIAANRKLTNEEWEAIIGYVQQCVSENVTFENEIGARA